MPTAIVAGVPAEIDRRIQATLKKTLRSFDSWELTWLRSTSSTPGVAPSQVDSLLRSAAAGSGAQVLVFRGRAKAEEDLAAANIKPFFRLRWLNQALLKLIPHSMNQFFGELDQVLLEEAEWRETVKPADESCCLLLPECSFAADARVRHLWRAATEPGLERIRLAAQATAKFDNIHWQSQSALNHAVSPRRWIDVDSRIFDHRGPRHGVAPFPRPWRFSYRVADGFHFDVTASDGRGLHLTDHAGRRHVAAGTTHINIDPHGHVRG